MNKITQLSLAVEKGKRADAKALTQTLLDEGMKPLDIVEQGLVPGMSAIGEKFKNNEVFVPEMLIAARAMKECMVLLEPLLVAAGIKPKYTAVIGTVQGDLHDIGKNLVAMMLKGANFGVVDIGTNVPPEKFVATAKEQGAQVVCLSALLTTTMPAMRDAVAAIRSAGLGGLTILVGGLKPMCTDRAWLLAHGPPPPQGNLARNASIGRCATRSLPRTPATWKVLASHPCRTRHRHGFQARAREAAEDERHVWSWTHVLRAMTA
jgi:5-methyltetrahydrofolate--homocysteine methyltransferase